MFEFIAWVGGRVIGAVMDHAKDVAEYRRGRRCAVVGCNRHGIAHVFLREDVSAGSKGPSIYICIEDYKTWRGPLERSGRT
jgi:hypothetical protein